MRNSQNAATLSVDELGDVYLAHKPGASDPLVVDFCKHFGFVSPTAPQHWSDMLAKSHHLVVIADGTDEETIQAVNHWRDSGLDIQLWPYRNYGRRRECLPIRIAGLVYQGPSNQPRRTRYLPNKYRTQEPSEFRVGRLNVEA